MYIVDMLTHEIEQPMFIIYWNMFTALGGTGWYVHGIVEYVS